MAVMYFTGDYATVVARDCVFTWFFNGAGVIPCRNSTEATLLLGSYKGYLVHT